MSDDPLNPHVDDYGDFPDGPVETMIPVDEISDSVVVRAVKIDSPVKDLTGRTVPLGALIFTFANSTRKEDNRPVTFVATPDILRNLGRVIRDTANRAANLAEGKR